MSVSIDVEPGASLVFQGSFTTPIHTQLTIRNMSQDNAVIFRLKSTRPDRYAVIPHRGEIQPGACLDIEVTLKPFYYTEDENHNDKFLLQACVATRLFREYSKHDFWSMLPTHQLYERKLRCVLRPTGGINVDRYRKDGTVRTENGKSDHHASVESKLRERLIKAEKELEKLRRENKSPAGRAKMSDGTKWDKALRFLTMAVEVIMGSKPIFAIFTIVAIFFGMQIGAWIDAASSAITF